MAKLSAPDAFDREESRDNRSGKENEMNLSVPDLCKIRTIGTYYSNKKNEVKSTSPEPLIHRPLFIFYFAYSPLHLVSVSVVLNEAGCFSPWSGDTAGPPSHIYSSLVTMTRNINTRVLLNQV